MEQEPECLFVPEAFLFLFFLAGIKYQQTLLVLQIQPSERRAQQQARQ